MGISQTNFKNILKTFSALFLTKHPVNKIRLFTVLPWNYYAQARIWGYMRGCSALD